MEKKKVIYRALVLILIVILLIVFYILFKSFFPDVQQIKTFLLSFGAWSPVVFILLQIAQVLIAPIPGQLVGFVGVIYLESG